jgi:hypothetical protein
MAGTQNALTGFVDVAIALGISRCTDSGCPSPEDEMGFILFNGLFRPQSDPSDPAKPPHQNVTVNIPASLAGPAQLNLAHFVLVAVSSPIQIFET